jgi:iron complex transport system permease protein
LLVIGVVLLAVCALHLGLGSSINYAPTEIIRVLLAGPRSAADGGVGLIVWQSRLPRLLGAVLIGALLGGAGCVFQALFRNRLADPYVIGTSSGAAAGGVLAILLGLESAAFGLAVPAFAFVAGLGSLGLVLLLTLRRGMTSAPTLLLAGVMVGAFQSALMSLGLYLSGADANKILRWLLGSVDPMFWNRVALLAGVLVVAGLPLLISARKLNALAFGEDTALRLGVNVGRVRTLVLICGAAMTAAAVGSAGIIGFVGLVAPHLARRLVGIDWRVSLPGSFLLGPLVLVSADILAARLAQDALPVGIVTALVGAPFLLALLARPE